VNAAGTGRWASATSTRMVVAKLGKQATVTRMSQSKLEATAASRGNSVLIAVPAAKARSPSQLPQKVNVSDRGRATVNHGRQGKEEPRATESRDAARVLISAQLKRNQLALL